MFEIVAVPPVPAWEIRLNRSVSVRKELMLIVLEKLYVPPDTPDPSDKNRAPLKFTILILPLNVYVPPETVAPLTAKNENVFIKVREVVPVIVIVGVVCETRTNTRPPAKTEDELNCKFGFTVIDPVVATKSVPAAIAVRAQAKLMV